MRRLHITSALVLLVLTSPLVSAAAPPAEPAAVHLTGHVSDFWFSRNWATYYWREDFTFILTEDGTGKTRRIISREPTPAYIFRMGTTFPDLKVDWKAKPRIKVYGVQSIDRAPPTFYDFKLDDPALGTALAIYVETAPDTWKPYYLSNWFHKWGAKTDKLMHELFADKPAPYDIYGFVRGQVAPFDATSQAIIDKNKDNPSLMFHGRIHASKNNAFGYELELIDLVGRDVKTGGHVLLHGDGKSIPLLDGRK